MIRTVAVIGAGTAGRGFAIASARAGFHVVLEDVMPANLRRAKDDFEQSCHSGARDSATPESPYLISRETNGSLATALTVEDAVRSADLVIDFVPDELESKLEIFSMLDRMAPPRTILVTPSDAQSITDLASCTYRPERCFALRGLTGNALGSGPLAHIVYPAQTDEVALKTTAEFLTAVGCAVSVAPDPIAPMLIKNQPRT